MSRIGAVPVRRAGLGDAALLAYLHGEGFIRPWPANDFAAMLAQPGMAAWLAGEPPQGFILVRAAADEAEILTLAVRPEARRAGLASVLASQALATLRAGGTRRLFLEVAADNVPARALYGRLGFSRCGERPGYYDAATGARTDAIVMALDLGECPGSV